MICHRCYLGTCPDCVARRKHQRELEAKATGEKVELSRGDQVVWRFGMSPTMTVTATDRQMIVCAWWTHGGEFRRSLFKRCDLVLLGPAPTLEEIDRAGKCGDFVTVAAVPMLGLEEIGRAGKRGDFVTVATVPTLAPITRAPTIPLAGVNEAGDLVATKFRFVEIGFVEGLGMVTQYDDGAHSPKCSCSQCANHKVLDFPSKNPAK